MKVITTVVTLLLMGGVAHAAVSPEEAARLKKDLTPFGAERAANADGSIPAWDGGYTKAPAGYRNGDARPDFFPDETPLYSITPANVDQYAGKLAEGVVALLKKNPDFRVDVYPTHRSAAAPQWVYDNTFKNATTATSSENGMALTGAYGGIPFPIPKTGTEAMWNFRLTWRGEAENFTYSSMVVTPDGKVLRAAQADETHQYPMYFKDTPAEKFSGEVSNIRLTFTAPAAKAGESILTRDPIDLADRARPVWQYLVGQRRVRRAPSIAYDTPDFVTSGIGFFDEAFMFLGAMNRYDWKIVGKREMYLPYNNNRAAAAKLGDLVKPKFLSPDLVRWELHRVWEVEATLAAGKRHVVPKRRYYIDEDSWQIVLVDGWDAQGQLWRMQYSLTLLAPEIPVLTGTVMWGVYNLQTGGYVYNAAPNEMPVQLKYLPPFPDDYFSPDSLANQGVR